MTAARLVQAVVSKNEVDIPQTLCHGRQHRREWTLEFALDSLYLRAEGISRPKKRPHRCNRDGLVVVKPIEAVQLNSTGGAEFRRYQPRQLERPEWSAVATSEAAPNVLMGIDEDQERVSPCLDDKAS